MYGGSTPSTESRRTHQATASDASSTIRDRQREIFVTESFLDATLLVKFVT